MNTNNYFRITGYYPKADVCFIADINGKFNALWEFSSYLVKRGVKVIAVGKADKFIDGNIPKAEPDKTCLIIRACDKGKPIVNGNSITIRCKTYITGDN
jgi:hypothetical protein